jgi:hypothetical protein
MKAQSWQKEQISIAYLHAIATCESCTIARWNVDKDGVDATLRRGHLMVDLQLKCTQRMRQLDGAYSFDLDVPTYDKLRVPERSAPGYLAVMVVRGDLEEWIVYDGDQLLVRCTAFYACLQDRPPATGTATTAIHLPVGDRLNGGSLDLMFEHSRRRILAPVTDPVSA